MPSPLVGSTDALRDAAAGAIAGLTGVVRLEPTLSAALVQLRAAGRVRSSTRGAVQSAGNGIRLARRGDLVDIAVDLTVSTTQPADLTAGAAYDALQAAVLAHQLEPGQITVTVLRLQPPPAG